MRKPYSRALAFLAGVAMAGPAFAQATTTQAEVDAYYAAAAETQRTGDPTVPLRMAREFCRRGVPNTCQYVAPLEGYLAEYQRTHPGAGAAAQPQMRPGAPSVAQRAPANAPATQSAAASAGQSGPRSRLLNPQTGRPCVIMEGWERSGENAKHLNFRNTCNLTFGITLRAPGVATRGSGIGPGATMFFTFVRSDPQAWAAEWSYEVYGGQ